MSYKRATLEACFRLDSSASPGLGTGDAVGRRTASGALPAGANLELVAGNLPLPREFIQEATVIYESADATSRTVAHTWRGLDGWIINGDGVTLGTNAGYVSNAASEQSIVEVQFLSDWIETLHFSGAAATAVNSLTGVGTFKIMSMVSRTSNKYQTSDALLDVFIDTAIDTALPSVAALTDRTLKKIRAQGMGLLTLAEQGNTKIQVPGVAAAFGWRNPIIIAADIGNGFGQVPADKALWTPATFAPHPRAFLRASQNVFGLRLLEPVRPDTAVVIADDPALAPYLAASKPTHSIWRFMIKGAVIDCIISHGALDLRRPRDIWRSLIAPACNQGASSPLLTYSYHYVGDGKVFYPSGQIDTLPYLDYAICLDLISTADEVVLQHEEE